MNIRLKINPKMLGNHPFAWFITFAFFCEVFKEHLRTLYIIISAESLQQVCFGIPSKLNNVSVIKRPDVNDLGLEPYVSRIQISIERR